MRAGDVCRLAETLFMLEEVPITDVGRIARIVSKQVFVICAYFFNGFRVLVDIFMSVLLKPRYRVKTLDDTLGYGQTLVTLSHVAVAVGDTGRLTVTIDIAGVKKRMEMKRFIGAG